MGSQNMSSEDAELLARYNEDWTKRLEGGFRKGSVFFAWLMLASRPKDEWPDWCREYLVQVAERLLKQAALTGTYLYPAEDIEALQAIKRAYPIFGIKSPKKNWDMASVFLDELEMFVEDPKQESYIWSRGLQFSRRNMLLLEEEEKNIKLRAKSIAGDTSSTILAAREEVAEEGVEIDPNCSSQSYSDDSSMRRALRNRRKKLKRQSIE